MVITWRSLNSFALTLRLALMMGVGAVISKARTTEVGSSFIGASISPVGWGFGRSATMGLTSLLFPRLANLADGFLFAATCGSPGCSGGVAPVAEIGGATTTRLVSLTCGRLG